MQLHAQVVAALLIALSTATASPAGAAASAPAPSRRPEPPREGVDWDSFGFSLNGVRTDFMYVATCTTNGVSEGEDPWLVPCGSSSGSSDDAAGEDGFSSNRYSGGGRIVPHAPIAMDPASTVLNYGQVLFEGLKAIRHPDGSIVVFRPESNAKRMADGARRLCMPPVSEELFVEAITQTVRANCAWVPPAGKGALYLRPLLLGSGGALGVGPSPEYTFLVYCSPVGGYFKKKKVGKSAGGTGAAGGLTEDEGEGDGRGAAPFVPPPPIRLLMTPRFHRSVEGGVGSIKASGNYAPCFKASKQIKAVGYDEVLFLDAKSDAFVEEAGASNFFAVGGPDGRTLFTPGLGRGSILPGITRASIVELARSEDFGLTVVEGDLAVDELLCANEAFCCGTGATITPVGVVALERGGGVGGAAAPTEAGARETGSLGAGHRRVTFPHVDESAEGDAGAMVAGPVTTRLAERMAGILAGTMPDKFGWIHHVYK